MITKEYDFILFMGILKSSPNPGLQPAKFKVFKLHLINNLLFINLFNLYEMEKYFKVVSKPIYTHINQLQLLVHQENVEEVVMRLVSSLLALLKGLEIKRGSRELELLGWAMIKLK